MKRLREEKKSEKWKPEITRAICLKCSGCCCTNPDILAALDYEQATRTLHKYKYEWSDVGFYGTHTLKKDASGACVYFDKKIRGCSIYKMRPLSCRAWFCGRGTKNDSVWQHIKPKRGHDRFTQGLFSNLLREIGAGL